MPNLVDIIIIAAVIIAAFFAIRTAFKSKGCVGCSDSKCCHGSCSSADKMVKDMQKAAGEKKTAQQ